MGESRRIFAPAESFRDGALLLEGGRLRHVRTVLRLGPGDEFEVTDGVGAEYRVRVERLGREAGQARILECSKPRRESPLVTLLAQGIPKADRFALILQKAVELGVSGIFPVLSRRTRPTGVLGEPALARWLRIVESAVAQSGRTRLPPVHPPRPWPDLLAQQSLADLRILLWERADEGLGRLLERRPVPGSVLIAVGPEGGWSDEEAQEARRSGFLAARLGPRILRTETAGLAALAVIQQRWGDLG